MAERTVVDSVYPDGNLDIEYVDKNQSLPTHLQSEVVWWAEEFCHRGDKPVTEADYAFLWHEAVLRSDAAVRAAGHMIRACGFCRHYDQQGEDGCLKFKTPVPWQEAVQCKDFAEIIHWEHEEIE